MKSLIVILALALSSCATTTVTGNGVRVTHRVLLMDVDKVIIEPGKITTTYHKANPVRDRVLPVAKVLFNWSVIKGVYDLVW